MDKNEYSIRLEEIKTLIAKQKYVEAAAIADTIDWRRVKKVMTLCTISDLYKINRRLEDARDVLLLAYDRHPGGRFIVYALCELSIKMGSFVEAVEYYKEFVQIAPRDSGRYVLQYKLYEAQEVSLEERIEVLEELKSKDYSEKWAYELAYLYHRVGLGTKCVEECDELILWFGEGRYVQKAMELKQLHAPLTNEQQVKYYQMQGIDVSEEYYPEEEVQETAQSDTDWMEAPTKEIPQQELDIQVKLMNVGQYDTINIQKELAENMKELLGEAPEEVLQEEAAQEELTQEELLQDDEVPEAFVTEEAERPESEYEAAANESELTEETQKTEEKEVAGETEAAEIKPSKFDKILGMEYDGQISMLVPDFERVEKQITGQIRLDDVLVEWEKMKKNSEQKRMEAVRQHVMEQTGAMFTEFEVAARDGLLEQLESDAKASAEETPEDFGESEEADAYEEEAASEYESKETEEVGGYESIADEEMDDYESEAGEEVDDYESDTDEEADDYESETDEEMDGYETETDEEADNYESDTVEEADDYESEADEDSDEYAEETEEESAEYEEEAEGGTDSYEAASSEKPIKEAAESGEGEEAGSKTKGADGGADEQIKEDAKEQKEAVKHEGSKVRAMSPEERQHFGHYLQSKATKEQIVYAIDNISMAAYTGNVIITGEEGMDTMTLAKNLIKEVQQTDSNFSGKIAKISGDALNKKKVGATFKKLVNGALIIQNAGALKKETAEQIRNALEQEHSGIIVVLEDFKKSMDKLLKRSPDLLECFNIRIDIEALDNDSLVAIGKKYAKDKEYSIDELGVLALHTCIADRQTSDHAVTVAEVREIMEEAIRHANRKTLGHFFDILLAKRYDEEDMIILREKDFV